MTTIIPRIADLSHYEDVQDKFAGAVKFGLWGVINKVTEGVGSHDASFGWRRQPIADAGLLPGAYHFARPGRLSQQADWFSQNIGDPAGLLLALDWEVPGIPLADVKVFLSRMYQLTGRWPWLYTYSSFLSENFTKADIADPFWKPIKLWGADYNSNPKWLPGLWSEPSIWQFTGDGNGPAPHNIDGIVIHGDKGIDINHFAGTRDELTAQWAA